MHGKARVWIEPVPGRLRRPPEIGATRPALFRYFIEQVRGLTGMLYGRRIYEIMRYWDDDLLVLRTPRPLPRLRCPKSNQGECEFR